jgi:hypothetical protein
VHPDGYEYVYRYANGDEYGDLDCHVDVDMDFDGDEHRHSNVYT